MYYSRNHEEHLSFFSLISIHLDIYYTLIIITVYRSTMGTLTGIKIDVF